MTVTTPRKPWTNEETDTLIRAWEDVGSIILLSILLKRSTSSVQTQASRIGLPRRKESLQRHRRRWSRSEERQLENLIATHSTKDNKIKIYDVAKAMSRSEERQLENLIATHSTKDNKIKIYDVAKAMSRSVDAIAAKLVEGLDDEAQLLERIEIPESIRRKLDAPKAPLVVERTYKKRGEIEDSRYKAKRRDCLMCRTGFWSEGAHNRICGKCSSAHENDESFGSW